MYDVIVDIAVCGCFIAMAPLLTHPFVTERHFINCVVHLFREQGVVKDAEFQYRGVDQSLD